MQNVKVDRDKYIGGSDIPIIMGISPFKKRWELLQEKAGLIESNFEGNEYTEYGNIMEPKIRDYINTLCDDKFIEGKDIEGDIRCHTDGKNNTTILEIKTTSQIHETIDDYKIYLVQLLFYMNHVKREKGILAVYSRPEDFSTEFSPFRLQIFHIELEDYKDLINQIEDAVEQFRIDLNKLKENPFLTEEELMPKNIVLSANKVVELEKKLSAYDKLKKSYETAKEELRQQMINANLKSWEMPNGTKITVVLDSPDKEIEEEYYDEEKFIKENEKLYNEYQNKLSKYKLTKIVIKKGRKGSIRITLPENL